MSERRCEAGHCSPLKGLVSVGVTTGVEEGGRQKVVILPEQYRVVLLEREEEGDVGSTGTVSSMSLTVMVKFLSKLRVPWSVVRIQMSYEAFVS